MTGDTVDLTNFVRIDSNIILEIEV